MYLYQQILLQILKPKYLLILFSILLIVLGLNIVFHSVKSYKTSEKGSEKAAV